MKKMTTVCDIPDDLAILLTRFINVAPYTAFAGFTAAQLRSAVPQMVRSFCESRGHKPAQLGRLLSRYARSIDEGREGLYGDFYLTATGKRASAGMKYRLCQ